MIDRHSGRLLSDFTLKSHGRFSPRVDRGCFKPADFRKLPDGLVRGLRPLTKPSGTFGNSKIDGLNFARLEEKKFRTEKKKFRPGKRRFLPSELFGPESPENADFFFNSSF